MLRPPKAKRLPISGPGTGSSAGGNDFLTAHRVSGEPLPEFGEQGICIGVPALAAQPLDRLKPGVGRCFLKLFQQRVELIIRE